MIDVAIVGASGYGGGELLRLLAGHPGARVRTAVSETYAGQPVSVAWPGMAKRSGLVFTSNGDGAEVAQCDVVFLAQENGKAMHTVPHLLEAGCKVVDLSADFRLRDVGLYATWYKQAHAAVEVVTRQKEKEAATGRQKKQAETDAQRVQDAEQWKKTMGVKP